MYYFFFFFFSSRRRHTRSYGDWSSDVCSSDLRRRNRRPEKRHWCTGFALEWRGGPGEFGTLGGKIAAGLPDRVCAARCAGLRAQRDCGDHGLLSRKLEVAAAQGADSSEGFVAGRTARPSAAGTPRRKIPDGARRLSYNERT